MSLRTTLMACAATAAVLAPMAQAATVNKQTGEITLSQQELQDMISAEVDRQLSKRAGGKTKAVPVAAPTPAPARVEALEQRVQDLEISQGSKVSKTALGTP